MAPTLSFPVAIVRPTIIGAALDEPFPGFIDNFNALTGKAVIMSQTQNELKKIRSKHFMLTNKPTSDPELACFETGCFKTV